MFAPQPNKPRPENGEQADAVDLSAVHKMSIIRGDRGGLALMHFGFKAFAHALLAHEALKGVETGNLDQSRLEAHFRLRENPLSFSLHGVAHCGFVTPEAALKVSSQMGRNLKTPSRVEFASRALVEPLLTPPKLSGAPGSTLPAKFAEVNWSREDLRDRAKLGAVLVFAMQLLERSLFTFSRQEEMGARSSGALDTFARYLSAEMGKFYLGELRGHSLALGERYLLGLREGRVVAPTPPPPAAFTQPAPSVVEEGPVQPSRSPAFLALVRRVLERGALSESAVQRKDGCVPNRCDHDAHKLEMLALLRRNLRSADLMIRAGAQLDLMAWRGSFSEEVEHALKLTISTASAIQVEERALGDIRDRLETGDPYMALEKINSLLDKGAVRLLHSEAVRLRALIQRVLTAPAELRAPTFSWPGEGNALTLGEALHQSFMWGAEAEVFTHSGCRFSGRLACYVPKQPTPGESLPGVLSLIDDLPKDKPEHEKITWVIRIPEIVKINFFLYDEPAPQRIRVRKQPAAPKEKAQENDPGALWDDAGGAPTEQ